MTDVAGKMKLRQGINPPTEMGPPVLQEQLERVIGYIESGKREMGHAVLDAYTQTKTVWVNLR